MGRVGGPRAAGAGRGVAAVLQEAAVGVTEVVARDAGGGRADAHALQRGGTD